MSDKWNKLDKIGVNTHILESQKCQAKCTVRVNFVQVCFDNTEDERLFAIDSKGIAYLILYSLGEWTSKNLGIVGQSSAVAFNPHDKFEVIVGLASSIIKIIQLKNNTIDDLCLLPGHELPPSWVSFYENYCLTSSQTEAIIWDLRACCKIHQLQLVNNENGMRKAVLSPLGCITALYKNDTIQSWRFNQFDTDTRVSLGDYGLKNVRDFVYTDNGRALIICGARGKMIVIETTFWNVIKTLNLPESIIGVRRLISVPLAAEIGAKNLLAIHFDNSTVKFFDLTAENHVKLSEEVKGVRKIILSPHGQWVATIPFDGSLAVSSFHRLISLKRETRKMAREMPRPRAHSVDQHLKYIQRSMRRELKLSKLLPILNEFGEYPERHRITIWKTLMKLPGNRKAFASLNSKLSNEGSRNLKQYRLFDKNRANMLKLNVNRLVQICPLFEHSNFLPEFIFPFLIVFQNDTIAAFEAVLTVLMNFCQQWFEYHPFPPLNILGIIENALMEADSNLLKFYCDHGITSTQYAWPLLYTAMSEIFSTSEWLIFWDHLLSHREPSLLILSVVAYNICSKGLILLLRTSEEFKGFFRQPGQVSVKEVLKTADRLNHAVSWKNHPSRYFRNDFCALPSDGPYPPILLGEYPKFLVENPDETAREEEEAHSLVEQKIAAKAAEAKRFVAETDRFIEKIQRQRLCKVQQCYESQCVTKAHSNRENSVKSCQYPSARCLKSTERGMKKSCLTNDIKNQRRFRSCEKLRQEVKNLEDEVETFMETIKTQR